MDYQFHAKRLADLVEEFIWCHSGGDDGRALPAIYSAAIEALEAYRKDASPQRVKLKTLMRLAEQQARTEGKDSYAEMLKAIAYRSKDCYEHMDDDREVYQDIKEWLEYEAGLEIDQ